MKKVFELGDRVITPYLEGSGVVTKVINDDEVYCLFEDGSCGAIHTSVLDLHEPRNNYASDLILLFSKMGVTFKDNKND